MESTARPSTCPLAPRLTHPRSPHCMHGHPWMQCGLLRTKCIQHQGLFWCDSIKFAPWLEKPCPVPSYRVQPPIALQCLFKSANQIQTSTFSPTPAGLLRSDSGSDRDDLKGVRIGVPATCNNPPATGRKGASPAAPRTSSAVSLSTTLSRFASMAASSPPAPPFFNWRKDSPKGSARSSSNKRAAN